jgi:hypothetical protein
MSPDITAIMMRFSQDQFVGNYMGLSEENKRKFINSLVVLIFIIC